MKDDRNVACSEKRLSALLLVVFVHFAYWPALNGGFIFDDFSYVQANPLLRNTEGLGKIWFEPKANPQYYPLTFTTFWIEFQWWQLWTMGYHLTNVILHSFNALLMWKILQRLAVPGAWCAAAIFALHPVHVESVAWISERKNVLSGVFYLLALMCYLRFAPLVPLSSPGEKLQWRYYGFALVCFVCALLSKSVTCSLPAVILLLIWWKKGNLSRSDCLPLIPMFILGMIASSVSAALEWHPEVVGATGDDWHLTATERVLIAGRAFWFYLATLFYPVNLTFIYPRWIIDTGLLWQYLFPLGAIVGILILGIFHQKIGRAPIITVLFFVGTLFPTLGFLSFYFMRYSFVSDHFQYLASIGPIVLIGSVLGQKQAVAREPERKFYSPFFFLPLFSVRTLVSGLVLLSLGSLTWKQAHVYKSAEVLWSDTLQRNPTNGTVYNNLAVELFNKKEFSQALSYLEKAIVLDPKDSLIHSNLSLALLQMGNLARALEHGYQALKLRPKFASYADKIGTLLWRKGDLIQAESYFREAERRQFVTPDIHYHLGLLALFEVPLLESGGPQEGISQLEKALHLDSGWTVAAKTLSWVLATFPDLTIQDSQRAIALAEQVCATTEYRDIEAIDILGAAYASAGRFEEAIRVAQIAVKAATTLGHMEFAGRVQKRIDLYQMEKPYFDMAKEKFSL